MKNIKYLIAGVYFGFVLNKSEVISWFRIQEMFRFDSFHMYGVLGVGVVTAALSLLLFKKFNIKSLSGEDLKLGPKKLSAGTVLGGLMFGFGWAITGACPGPLYTLIGSGFTVISITLLSAILGAWFYGLLRDKIPA
ncbi:MAG: YeeE/YedE family protein [Bacteroidia bacterium]|nr:YeeE/YedE family protein [Bacteroidia bacterium]